MGQSSIIGHVLPETFTSEIVNPVFGDFIAGATETCKARGFSVSLSIAAPAEEEAVYRRFKSEGSVAGVVLQGPSVDDRRIGLLNDVGLPFVVHGRASKITEPYSWVDVNNNRAFNRATGFLLDLGHERIGLINGQLGFDFATRRHLGYETALQQAGVTRRADLQASGDMTEANGYGAASQMLDGADPPTAFVVASMISAIGVRRAVHERGLELGREISLITYDDDLSYFSNRDSVPVFTAIRSSVRLAGQEVAGMLADQIADPDGPAKSILLEAELVVGRSTGPNRAA